VRRSASAFAALAALAFAPGAPAADAPVFKAGFAERDVTPDVGSEQPGGYGKAYHRSIHDPCKVRAAVFDDGAYRVAVVGIDALGIARPTVLAARTAITAKTGIPGDAILIGASHSHSSGPTVWVMPGEYDGDSELVRTLAYKYSTCADAKYLRRVEQAIVDAVGQANDTRVESKAGVGKGIENKVAFNRRFQMRDGRTVTHPGQGNPDIVEPAGPTDPEVGVIGAWDGRGKLLGCVVNFACHATTSPGGASANYIYYLEKTVRGYFGKDAVVVFLPGASGDVTQVDNRSAYKNPTGDRWAHLVGGRVGAEAVKVLLSVEPGPLTPVAARTKVWPIRRRVPDPDKVRHALDVVSHDAPEKGDRTEWTFAKETVLLDAKLKREPAAEVEVQAIQVGPAVFLTTPAEHFCAFGLEQKAKSGFPFAFPVSLANGCVGYVPTAEAFGPAGGGYETRLTSYGNLDVTAGRQMCDAGLALAKQLKPGTVPTAPKALPFAGHAWTYGDVRPEVK
jgi:neutral ceramidase